MSLEVKEHMLVTDIHTLNHTIFFRYVYDLFHMLSCHHIGKQSVIHFIYTYTTYIPILIII
jgi:hypothetical protein